MKIKWLFFDIDNTLFDSTRSAEQSRKNAIRAMISAGLKAKEEPAYEKLKIIIEEQGSNYEHHFNELVEFYNKEEKRRIVAAGVVAYHNTTREYLVPFEGVSETLTELSKNYKLGIISNGLGVKQWEKLIRLGLSKFFDLAMISEEIGIEKPDKMIFEEGLEKAGCKAGEAVMVGDKKDDLKPAKEIGMHTVSVNSQVRADYNIKEFRELLGVVKKLG